MENGKEVRLLENELLELIKVYKSRLNLTDTIIYPI